MKSYFYFLRRAITIEYTPLVFLHPCRGWSHDGQQMKSLSGPSCRAGHYAIIKVCLPLVGIRLYSAFAIAE